MGHIAGYALRSDYSERVWQLEGTGQWVKGKSEDGYAPFGPFWAMPDDQPSDSVGDRSPSLRTKLIATASIDC